MGRIEKWSTDLFPGRGKVLKRYQALSPRETAIVGAAVLDAALAELLLTRLVDLPVDASGFLGTNGDGRAPCGTFGARIQLALLIGLLPTQIIKDLRAIKQIRNHVAHRVTATLLDGPVQAQLDTLRASIRAGAPDAPEVLLTAVLEKSRSEADAAKFLVAVTVTVQEEAFHRTLKLTQRIPGFP